MSFEFFPESVDEHTAKVEDVLGATSAPTHSRTIEAHGDEVAHSPFDRTGADVEGWGVGLAQVPTTCCVS